MRDVAFARAVAVADALGSCDVGGTPLRHALRLGGTVSLWDVAVAYLTLYRFPLLCDAASPSARGAFAGLTHRLRPYRGSAARLADRLSRSPRTAAACGAWSTGRPTILFTAFTPGFYRDVLRPVAEHLTAQRSHRIVILTDHPSAVTWPRHPEIACESPDDHWDAAADAAEADMLRRLRDVSRVVFSGRMRLRLQNAARSAGCVLDVIPELKWLFWREIARLIPRLAAARHVLDRHRPVLLISADDADQRCRVYSLQARILGIPSLLVQQGLSRAGFPEWRLLSHDMVAAMGRSTVTEALSQGVAGDRLVVTGHPGFDQFASCAPGDDDVRQELRISGAETLLLFASQPPVPGAFGRNSDRVDMIRALFRAASAVEGIRLVVKPHPGDRRAELVRLAAAYPSVTVTAATRDIAPLIRACDAFATFFSTSTLQALYAGKPVLTLDFHGEAGARRFVESDATFVARSAGDINAILRSFTSMRTSAVPDAKAERRRVLLDDEVGSPDGNASARVVDLAGRLLGRSRAVACG